LYLYNLISDQLHRSTRSSDIITLSRPPSTSSLKVNNRSFRHASPCQWNQLPKELRCLQITKTYHSHLISHMSVRHFLHHHCHHPLLILTSTPGSKLFFSTNLFLRSYSTFPPTGLTSRTPGVFRFYSASALLAMQSAVLARGIPSVRLSVCLSVTFRYCVQTHEDTIVRFSASGMTISLVCGDVMFIRIFAGDNPQRGR